MSYNIIGDIAGQFKTLCALLAKMPDGEPISVGDMLDRGPNSEAVVNFFINEGRAVLGNHEDMFIEFLHGKEGVGGKYGTGIYQMNGGDATLSQFDTGDGRWDIPQQWVNWIRDLPLEIRLDVPNEAGQFAIITHAPIHPIPEARRQLEYGCLWNRNPTLKRIDGYYQLFGHNSYWDCRMEEDEDGPFATCLDTYKPMLVGMHWPSMKLYSQEFID